MIRLLKDNTRDDTNASNPIGNHNSNHDMADKDEMIVQLQHQLQCAQSQIYTADLIRKELEDTIEAEQYTWELLVQDLEREITALNSS
jgi:hypothetical protein